MKGSDGFLRNIKACCAHRHAGDFDKLIGCSETLKVSNLKPTKIAKSHRRTPVLNSDSLSNSVLTICNLQWASLPFHFEFLLPIFLHTIHNLSSTGHFEHSCP
ncbi:hypothetical protein LBUCD034_0488 [Lentilactobacillus buchneri subsp. silagei CD034]|uniref:Uncharacterized protein n=1 Tax=Lentilactobacillus buchneri subsp. silagei CD034 TaxID=1071400 RepID=J9W5Q0_LENBU|nr:hypothetical protein LBUCD034_0488 [Lentilactobacillus buchneri subsp. silagei CD034]